MHARIGRLVSKSCGARPIFFYFKNLATATRESAKGSETRASRVDLTFLSPVLSCALVHTRRLSPDQASANQSPDCRVTSRLPSPVRIPTRRQYTRDPRIQIAIAWRLQVARVTLA
jgi:hypothetical protein